MRFAAVELGGTTIRVAVAEGSPDNIKERASFPTGEPGRTLPAVRNWLELQKPFVSLGVASFGPIDPKEGSPTYGYITTTPKPGWRMVNVLQHFRPLGVPIVFDTDVNAPAASELAAAQRSGLKADSLAYITIGTGVGVGLVVNGKTVHGLLHPEAGHILAPSMRNDNFGGMPDHKIRQGVEAHCSAPALAMRAGVEQAMLGALPDGHPVWEAAAYYIAVLCANLVLIASPERIVIGGGVMQRRILYPMVRLHLQELLNGYLAVDEITDEAKLENYVVPPMYGEDAGLVGALTLSAEGHQRTARRPSTWPILSIVVGAAAAALLIRAVRK
jgi:fructokinase